jgi:hypothetical protein
VIEHERLFRADNLNSGHFIERRAPTVTAGEASCERNNIDGGFYKGMSAI